MKKREKSEVYNVEQTAKKLGVSRGMCYRLCRRRQLPGVIFLGPTKMVCSKEAIDRLVAGVINERGEPQPGSEEEQNGNGD